MHRFRAWFLGLFLMAQLVGVMPLIYAHTLHVLEGGQVVTDGGATTTRHQGSTPDEDDACCLLHHHLTGVLPDDASYIPVSFAKLRMVAPPVYPLASADPTPNDRPPKLLPLV